MRRLLRWSFKLCAALSAVLFVGLCALWVRSYWYYDRWLATAPSLGTVTVWSVDARLGLQRCGPERFPWVFNLGRWDLEHQDRQCGGLHLLDDPTFELGMGRCPTIRLPHWVVALALGGVPGFWWVAVRRSRRARRSGFCAACGYDLRVTPARCPECGHVPAKEGVTR
jgi:hypothetical protein